jgi:tRNA A37 methylthiotransferase MiaB
LLEGVSRRSSAEQPQLVGRTDANKKCVVDARAHVACDVSGALVAIAKGDFIRVRVTEAGPATLKGVALERLSSLA